MYTFILSGNTEHDSLSLFWHIFILKIQFILSIPHCVVKYRLAQSSNFKKICSKCDLVLTNFKLLEVIILQSNSTKPDEKSTSYSEMLKASENAKIKSSSSSKTIEPVTKKAKKDHFEINERVWYYDRKTKQSEKGIITKKETPIVYVVTNEDDDSFHINIKAISKLEEWFYQYFVDHPKHLFSTFKLFWKVMIVL